MMVMNMSSLKFDFAAGILFADDSLLTWVSNSEGKIEGVASTAEPTICLVVLVRSTAAVRSPLVIAVVAAAREAPLARSQRLDSVRVEGISADSVCFTRKFRPVGLKDFFLED